MSIDTDIIRLLSCDADDVVKEVLYLPESAYPDYVGALLTILETEDQAAHGESGEVDACAYRYRLHAALALQAMGSTIPRMSSPATIDAGKRALDRLLSVIRSTHDPEIQDYAMRAAAALLLSLPSLMGPVLRSASETFQALAQVATFPCAREFAAAIQSDPLVVKKLQRFKPDLATTPGANSDRYPRSNKTSQRDEVAEYHRTHFMPRNKAAAGMRW